MIGLGMAIDWRTIQVFLSSDGVCEVEADPEDYTRMRCTCSAFKRSRPCKHTKFIKQKIKESGGSYSIVIPADLEDEAMEHALKTSKNFRSLIIHHAKVEVLE
jgi:hypothetical protein